MANILRGKAYILVVFLNWLTAMFIFSTLCLAFDTNAKRLFVITPHQRSAEKGVNHER